MDLDTALKQFDAVKANLNRLQDIWDELSDLIPEGLAVTDGADPEGQRYRELTRAYEAIIKAMPVIGSCAIETVPWELNAIGQARLDAREIGEFEAELSVEEGIQAPGREIEEYRARLQQARRELVRDHVITLVARTDDMLRRISQRAGQEGDGRDDPEWEDLDTAFSQLQRLSGSIFPRRQRWQDMQRHLSFGQSVDLGDIVKKDWPVIRSQIQQNLYSDLEPLPVEVDDLAALVQAKPSGPVTTKLNWSAIDDEEFERLLFNIVSDASDYTNPQWLTKTRASDAGRDLAVERVSSDSLSGTKNQRVIIQAKHWLSQSVRLADVSEALAQMDLWEPPRVHALVLATSGRFTQQAVAWVEKHNEAGKQPVIEMWAESHLELLLAQRPHLVAGFKLR